MLRASINLGNAVLAAGTPEEPRGVTVDLARAIASRSRNRDAATTDFLHDLVEELKTSGFVAESLARTGRGEVTVAPPG